MTRLIFYFALAAMCLATAVYWQSNPIFLSRQSVIQEIEYNLSAEVERFRLELRELAKSPDSSKAWESVANSFLLYDTTGITRWTTSRYLPDPRNFDNDSIEYFKSGSNHYLVAQRVLPNNKVIVGFLSLQEGFAIQNQYLITSLNSRIFPMSGVEFQALSNGADILFEGRKLFSVSIASDVPDSEKINVKAWLALILGLSIMAIVSVKLIAKLVSINRRWLAVISLFLILLAARLLMVYGNFPYLTGEISIFNPKEFASSTFNNSIGNLFFNTVALFLVSVLTLIVYKKPFFEPWRRVHPLVKFFSSTAFFLLFLASQLLPFLYLETLYHNSIITPDISQQLSFDLVRLFAVSSILLSSFTGVFFSFTFFKLATRACQRNGVLYLLSIFLAALIFVLYHHLTDRNYEIPLLLSLVNLGLLVSSSIFKIVQKRLVGVSSLILLQLMIYGLQTAIGIRWLSTEREHETMRKFGNTFLIERDVLGEYLLSQTISRIEQDAFIKKQIVNPFNRLSAIEQKIRHSHLNPYFDRYDTKIFLSDNRGLLQGTSQALDLPGFVKEFLPMAESTDYEKLYVVKNSGNRLVTRYLAVVPIKYHVSGFIIIDLTLRQVLPSAVFPKLLLENRFSSYAKSSSYSYAVFENGALVSAVGSFNYQDNLVQKLVSASKLIVRSANLNDYDHIAVHQEKGLIAVISARSYSLLSLIANFSFYFLIGISLVVLFWMVTYLGVSRNPNMTYSNRIRLYVYLAMVLPLAALAFTILRVNFYAEGERSEESSVKQARNLASSLAPYLSGPVESMAEEIGRQALGVGVDVTVYSGNGYMLASSQPDIYSNQILSRYINPRALQLISNGNHSFTIDESIGNLSFKNTYSTIVSDEGNRILGIVSIPFFASQESFERDQIQLVSNILVVFVAVFILFYLLSYLALEWLTNPLRVMSNVLQRTTLSGDNKKLIWNSKDEIGAMVREYNNMIDNLKKSKNELEQRQREAVWREMARQVAHEIKNPLTPIRLTLQQIEKSLESGQPNGEHTTARIKTILHQVDILNDIASSFSAFAQMPEPILEQVDLISLIHEVIALYMNDTQRLVTFDYQGESFWVKADRQLFSRILSNIILNALQSEKEDERIHVAIRVKTTDSFVTLSVSDNGNGMSKEVLDKIFIPYFSTKESGSGLGLAIAKQGVEQSGGQIWCESQNGAGTTFFVSLPLWM